MRRGVPVRNWSRLQYMAMERPLVYVSATCEHSRNLLSLMERTGFADAYSFVNVDKAKDLPSFVDRVPLLFDGASVVTDEELFNMFSDASSAVASDNPAPERIEPADTMCGSAFETSYDSVGGVGDGRQEAMKRDSCWRLDEAHERIRTPECEPMPKRGQES